MDQLTRRGSDGCFSSGLLTATGAETVYDTTVAITYAIDGILYVKATVADGATPTLDANTGIAFLPIQADKACVFLWCLNSANTVSVAQGEIVTVDGDTDIRKWNPQFPLVPTGTVPFAFHIIQTTGASSAFTFGSSNWNATGITKLIRNLATMPARPVNTVTA